MHRWLSALLLSQVGLGCQLSPATETDVVEQAIAGGEVDATAQHDAVFAIVSHHNGYSSFCTATLIAPNLLLTARHCVSEGGGDTVICGSSEFTGTRPGDSIFAANDVVPGDNSRWFQGRDVRVPSEGADTCGFDVALVVLGSNVPTSVAAPVVPRIDVPVMAGEPYVAVGYGNTNDSAGNAGTRMTRDELEVQCAPGQCPVSVIESTEFLGETGICSGDSGGPALDMDGKVVGVVSRGGDNCDTPIYGTVTAWRDWLMDSAVAAATLGGYTAPYWATTGSSEPPLTPNPQPTIDAGGDGHACSQPADCLTGYACYYEDNPSDAMCRAACSQSSDCSDGLTCRSLGGSGGVCLAGDADATSSGCSLGGASRSAGGWSLLLLALALLPVRRLRPAAAPEGKARGRRRRVSSPSRARFPASSLRWSRGGSNS